MKTAAALALALTGLSCAVPVDRKSDVPVPPGSPGSAQAVQVRYLGVAGFLIQRGDDVVLTAPLYSNPNLLKEAFGRIHPDTARIGRFHPETPPVDAVLVGHAHYDHLMDVPYVWQRRPGATIYGNSTMRNILAAYDGRVQTDFPTPVPVIPAEKVVALDDPARYKVDTRQCAGTVPSQGSTGNICSPWPAPSASADAWEYVTPTLRVRALCARHPPQFAGIHQGPGCVNAPLTALPERAMDYLEGPPLVYLIDFLAAPQGPPAFRVYFQDVPSDGRLGQVPDDLIAERAVDLALLCVGNWKEVELGDAHTIIRNLRPQHVMLGHWEDFFRDQSKPLAPAPLQRVSEYHRLVQDDLKALRCPEAPTLSLPAPQVLKVFVPQRESCALR